MSAQQDESESDQQDDTDWSEVESELEPADPGNTRLDPDLDPDDPQLPDSSSGATSGKVQKHPMIEKFGGPSGVLMEFQAGRVQRRKALEALRVWYDGKLEVAENQIQEAVRVHTAKARAEAEKFLARIDNEYLQYLGELGLQNVDKRQEMLVRLNEQTSKNLKKVMDADWPQPMKDSSISKIKQMHESFADKLTEELGDIADRDSAQ